MKKDDAEGVITLYPTKPVAKKMLGYVATFGYIMILVCIIVGIVKYLNTKDTQITCIMIGCVVGIILILTYLSQHFAWEQKSQIYHKGNHIVYDVYDIVDDLGSGKTTYKIESLKKVVKNKKYLLLNGQITQKEYLRKPKDIKQLKVMYYTEEAYKFFEEFAEKGK